MKTRDSFFYYGIKKFEVVSCLELSNSDFEKLTEYIFIHVICDLLLQYLFYLNRLKKKSIVGAQHRININSYIALEQWQHNIYYYLAQIYYLIILHIFGRRRECVEGKLYIYMYVCWYVYSYIIVFKPIIYCKVFFIRLLCKRSFVIKVS